MLCFTTAESIVRIWPVNIKTPIGFSCNLFSWMVLLFINCLLLLPLFMGQVGVVLGLFCSAVCPF